MHTQNPIHISSSPPSNHHQLQNQNATYGFAMRGFPLRRSTPYKISLRANPLRMADAKIAQPGPDTSSSEKNEKVPEKQLPPPPEKPLPDDCCGSGCVRCVWDIYYDELEAYNKLIAEFENRNNSDAK